MNKITKIFLSYISSLNSVQKLWDTFKFFSKHMKGDESLWAALIRVRYSRWYDVTDETWQGTTMSNINQKFFFSVFFPSLCFDSHSALGWNRKGVMEEQRKQKMNIKKQK